MPQMNKGGNILKDTPELCDYKLTEGEFIRYKGRRYCWCNVSENRVIHFTPKMIKG